MRKATRAIALLVLLASSALAQSRDPATADALFREARALMKKGDFASACPKLADSHRLDPAPGTAINLGDCLEKVGKLADALQAQRDALDLLSAGDKRIGPVKTQIAALEKRVPRLTIKLAPGAPTNTKVKRDDIELGEGSLGTALPVNPGEHWVTVVARGRADSRRKVTLKEGQAEEVEVEPSSESTSEGAQSRAEAQGPSPAHRGAPASQDAPAQKTIGWVLVAVGAVSLGVGGWYWAKAAETKGEACPADCSDLVDQEGRERRVATIGLIGGGVVLGTGIGLIVLAPSPGDQTATSRAAHSRIAGARMIGVRGVW